MVGCVAVWGWLQAFDKVAADHVSELRALCSKRAIFVLKRTKAISSRNINAKKSVEDLSVLVFGDGCGQGMFRLVGLDQFEAENLINESNLLGRVHVSEKELGGFCHGLRWSRLEVLAVGSEGSGCGGRSCPGSVLRLFPPPPLHW